MSSNILIVAGEASGDQHAAHLVTQLKQYDATLTFSGIGGSKMQQAGVSLFYNLGQYGVVGFVEVINHFKVIRQAFNGIKQQLLAQKPDLLILVDYPGFNLRLAKFAKAHGIKILYYISPQIWAWKAKRIETIKQCVDMMAVILPFEKAIYQKAEVPVRFVGHPLTDNIRFDFSSSMARQQFGLQALNPIIGILPGSRTMEIKRMLPVMLKAGELLAQQHPQLEFVLPLASSLSNLIIEPFLASSSIKVHVVRDHFHDVINCCHSLIIASGTATLEAALLAKPMAIIFKTSALTYTIASQVRKVKYIGLCNLLAQRMLVPEIIQSDVTAQHVYQVIHDYLTQPALYHMTINRLSEIKTMLDTENKDCSLAELVMEMLG